MAEISDLRKFIELYKEFGIELVPYETEEGYQIDMQSGSWPKLDGYTGFFSFVNFDKDGKFISQGFWE